MMAVLGGVRVLELAGLAPAPFCGLVLADFGAELIRIDRVGSLHSPDTLARGKKSISLNLKKKQGVELLMNLVTKSDVLIEPFRPGVMEKMGITYDRLQKVNPRIVYVRLTGFGQSGPFARKAGHDINYIATSGALSAFRTEKGKPLPPVNILGDFAGGGFLAALGTLLALIERNKSGKGQVVDANMIDGSAYLSTFLFKALQSSGTIGTPRGTGLLDGGAPFYTTYQTKDLKWVSVGAIEPQFFKDLLKGLEISEKEISQFNIELWPHWKSRFQQIFKEKNLEEWVKIFENLDACFAPVLELEEVMEHPHNKERGTLILNSEGGLEPPAAPRLSRTPGRAEAAPLPNVGEHTIQVLQQVLGMNRKEIEDVAREGVIGLPGLPAKL